jgi:hypothetical protein
MKGEQMVLTQRVAGVAGVLMLIAGMALPATALADNEPNGAASCMGIELAAISPPGSSDEVPSGSSQLVSEVKGLAAAQGVSPGSLFSWIASLHEGSHEDCDAALGGESTTAAATASRTTTDRVQRTQSTPRPWPKVL